MADQDVSQLRQDYADDVKEWEPIRAEGAIDMRHAAGDPWEPEDRTARDTANRPVVSPDELSQYINQVVNDARAAKLAVKFTPNGNGASDKTAEFYADKMREIEYRSKAQIAYTTAFENAVQRSYGFVRVSRRYDSARSLHQDLWIDAVHNPDFIVPDPYALMPDLSDMTRCWVREPWPVEAFNARWPDAKKEGRGLTLAANEAPTWVNSTRIFVSECWKVETKKRTLLILEPEAQPQPGAVMGLSQAPPQEAIGVFEDEPNRPAGRVLRTREVDHPTVIQQLTNGVEILENKTLWPGKYIPIVGCLGKVLYVDDGDGSRRKILSLIRLARDLNMMNAYLATCEAEMIGMTPKVPYFVRKGSLNQKSLDDLKDSFHTPIGAIEVEPRVEGMQEPPEFPQRNAFEPAIQALEIARESNRRAIQAAMAMNFMPTQAQRRNEKSGKALEKIQEMGQRGAYHFTDHRLDMITQVGIICEDLMDKVYDVSRQVGIRKPNDDAATVWINNPGQQDSVSTRGDHLVTVSVGPSYDSEREAASDFADTLAQLSPEVFALLGPMIIKLKNLGPIGDEMAELLETIQPPQVQAIRQQKKQQGANPDPQAVFKELAQTKAQLQQVMAAASEMQKQLETDAHKEEIKQQGAVKTKAMDADLQLKLQEMKNACSIEIARIGAAAKGLTLDAQLAADEEAQARDHAHEMAEAEAARQHDAALTAVQVGSDADAAEREHQQGLEAGDVAHQQALEQGEVSHDQALEQQESQAALTPPEEGAGA